MSVMETGEIESAMKAAREGFQIGQGSQEVYP